MNGNGLKAAIYIRVSTADQNLEMQRSELLNYAEARRFAVIQFYEDKATGTNTNRPGFQLLLSHANARKFDVVLVWRMDRWARSLRDLILSLQDLSDLGIQFISLKDGIDLSTATGRLMMHIVASFAQFEAQVIKERVISGIAAAKARGTRLGRPPTIDSKLVQNLRADGLSLGAIAKRIGISKTSVHNILSRNRSLIGSLNAN